jgi:hypothetical protein
LGFWLAEAAKLHLGAPILSIVSSVCPENSMLTPVVIVRDATGRELQSAKGTRWPEKFVSQAKRT